MIGQRVNNYEITRLIGSGAMGAVYEAEHPIIRRKVAVKVLQNQLIRDPMAIQRFFEEARVTSTIRHPHIVEIIDVGTLPDGVPYLIMELLEGETLASRLERVGRLDTIVALNFVLQAAAGLEAAHAHGVIHRDLKPDHLFLTADPRMPGQELVKVLDFGIAKLRGTPPRPRVETHSGTVMGTPLYMSPEQCSGLSSAVDQRTDIYALGVILYEALCGQPPFVAPGIGDILMMHTSSPPASPSLHRPDLPARVEQIILTALAKRPEHRYASMADLAAAIRAARTSTQRFVSPSTEPIEVSVRPSLAPKSEHDIARPTRPPSPSSSTLERAPSKPPGSDTERSATESSPLGHGSVGFRSKRSLLFSSLLALIAVGVLVLIVRGRWQRAPEESEPASSAAAQPLPLSEVAAPGRKSDALVTRVEPSATGSSSAPGATPATPLAPPVSRKPSSPVHLPPVEAAPAAVGAAPSPPARSTRAPEPSSSVSPAPPSSVAPANTDGYLSLDSAPWAEVYLGNKLLGNTPLLRVALAPGKHELTLKNPELHRATTYVVEVKTGSTVSRFVGWEQEGR